MRLEYQRAVFCEEIPITKESSGTGLTDRDETRQALLARPLFVHTSILISRLDHSQRDALAQ